MQGKQNVTRMAEDTCTTSAEGLFQSIYIRQNVNKLRNKNFP